MQKTKIHALLRAAASALVLIILLGAKEAECGPSTGGAPTLNATRVGDWLDDGEEFLMESETSRRILQAGKKKPTIPAVTEKKPFCDAEIYSSCIGPDSKTYTKRPCTYQNSCNRPGS
ncbi:hypothetical protein ABFS82_08G032800 [Erythranthe guttata]|uniref:Rapid alkalinization factor 1 n=1 Tax=Erythranthe guttata TaxID=4155 RepID=A0A022RW73_ERYGU|nr:hypothetical protein MIMGU_mgv1a016548mg [Erythranthe guttata]